MATLLPGETKRSGKYDWAQVRAVVDGKTIEGWAAMDWLEPV